MPIPNPHEQVAFPEGRYLTMCNEIATKFGGQTRAMIMRNRLITQHTGIPTTLLTTESKPVYDEVREVLRDSGQLVEGMDLLNLYEWYRLNTPTDAPDESVEALGGQLGEVAGTTTSDVLHPDGTVYYTAHSQSGKDLARDYRRADGSIYLRAPGPGAPAASRVPYILTDAEGRPIRSWETVGGWLWHWLELLAGDAERVFFVTDSRFALRDVMPRQDDRFYFLHLMHNNHVVKERRWNSQLSGKYAPLLDNIHEYDALVNLTHRQSEHLAMRYGSTSHRFVVPNPVELPELPETMPQREPATFVTVARLEPQKRLEHAIKAFAKVIEKRPEAKFQIYGDGKLYKPLADLIETLDVGKNVQLMGHDPRAKEALLHATGFIMTSVNEGYPLATLESLSFGCPVISYDINYGPREQISDGVDGYIVEAEDMDAVAERCIQMIDAPEKVAEMSRKALEKASKHDWRAFLDDWRVAFEGAVAQRPGRIEKARARLDVHALGWARPMPEGVATRLPGPASRLGRTQASSAAFRDSRTLRFDAMLTVMGEWPKGVMADRIVTLDAVCNETGEVAALPLEVSPEGRGEFRLASRFDLSEVFEEFSEKARNLDLRLRFTVHNWNWETKLGRPREVRPNFEVSFGPNDVLHLQRR